MSSEGNTPGSPQGHSGEVVQIPAQRDLMDSDGETKIKIDEKDTEKEDKNGQMVEDLGDGQGSQPPSCQSPLGRPQSTDSSGRPKSSNSGSIVFDTRKKGVVFMDGHQVTFTVTISMAIPTVEDETSEPKDSLKRKKNVYEAPRPQSYYHVEYYLVADELMKTDLVTYSMACKIYPERHDARMVATWQERDVTWVAWSHCHRFRVDKEMLLKMFTHTVEVRIWDTKDKLSTRAKFDRPKIFKFPLTKPGEESEEGGVKGTVSWQFNEFTEMQPKKAREVRSLPTEITFVKSDTGPKRRGIQVVATDEVKGVTSGEQNMESQASAGKSGEGESNGTHHALVAVPVKDAGSIDGRSSFSRLGRLAGRDETSGSAPLGADSRGSKSSDHPSKRSNVPSQGSKSKGGITSETPVKRAPAKSAESASGSNKAVSKDPLMPARRRSKKQDAMTQMNIEHIKKFGICVIPVRLGIFFTGAQTVTNRLEQPVPGVEDAFVTIQLDGPLMSEKLHRELNPLIIKIQSITNLPQMPVSLETLKQKCLPVHCSLEKSELRQFLNGPPLEVEIHDRDRKPSEIKLKASLFGDDLEDEKISNVGTVAGRRTLHNPFKDREKPWDPYGIAKLHLSDLLLGQRYMYLKIPVCNCPIPDFFSEGDNPGGKLMGIAGAVDGPVDSPIAAGHYLQAHTMLKVKVEIAYPLTTLEKVKYKEQIPATNECPFGRIVFKFDYRNVVFLNKLQALVTKINARALELDDMPQHVIDAALSTYKLSLTQQESRSLDIVTGFQVLDGTMHLFILEGLRDKAIGEIWEGLPQPENSDVKVLFNSNLTFSKRLYGPLDVDLCRVKLHEPLEDIVCQSLLYVRDMVPKPCFEGLIKLYQIVKATKVTDVVRNDLFPTADMVVSVSKEFGVPFTTEDFEELQSKDEKSEPRAEATVAREKSMTEYKSRTWKPLDNMNMEYMEKLMNRQKGSQVNFKLENIAEVKNQSEIIKTKKELHKTPTVKVDVQVAHNYSTQYLNSTEMAKEKLRQMLAKDPTTRYTYCQDYHHSMTVVPVNIETLKKEAAEKSQARWKTDQGWIYPGMKTMLEANIHPKKPHSAKIEELRTRWRENILHVGLLQPPLDRDKFSWDHRQQDFEIYQRPHSHFGHNEPITIHLSGQKLKQERLDAFRKEYDIWKSKIVVNDTRQYYHRCLPETELREQGQYASNQIAKLKDLLKDSPQKLSLRKPGMRLNEVPPLNVVLNPSVDTVSRLAGEPLLPAVEGEMKDNNKGFKPGPFEEYSWNLERNKVPAIDYEHHKFEDTKGHDFNVYHKDRSKFWKTPIVPLTDEERDNHLFWIPDDPKKFRALPELNHPMNISAEFLQPQSSQEIFPQQANTTLISSCEDSTQSKPSIITETPAIAAQNETKRQLELVVN
ncbi:hypothetical protein CHS0354_016147 [Potamilus streckersoni]|uniref:DUF4550 domain-containing protein n=1 Tax=Potamilus streckersoni TaxID=2493646 RepID=A0AAE0T1Z3_9BIVA|nr:hypothetical protein CHS0354_016147 [Potamilus streckersoni]